MKKRTTPGLQQERILTIIKEFVKSKGYPPSVRELCEATGLKSPSTVHSHLAKLESLGLIHKDPEKTRAIDVVGEYAWRNKKMVPVPLVGVVAAGQPMLAVENIEETFPLPQELVGTDDNVFMLAIKGESMINAGILDGDLVLVKEQRTAHNGEIVVAMLHDEEATVKRFFKEKDIIRLQPENDTMDPILSRDVAVIGKVIGLYRRM